MPRVESSGCAWEGKCREGGNSPEAVKMTDEMVETRRKERTEDDSKKKEHCEKTIHEAEDVRARNPSRTYLEMVRSRSPRSI